MPKANIEIDWRGGHELTFKLNGHDLFSMAEVIRWQISQSAEEMTPRLVLEVHAPESLIAKLIDVDVHVPTNLETLYDEPWDCVACGVTNDPAQPDRWADGLCWRCGHRGG
jgi:hypothetical protein